MTREAHGIGADVRAIAEAIADVLEERGLLGLSEETTGRVLKVAEVAQLLGRSRGWVYEHDAELGAFRFGTGPKAPLGFDLVAIERWKRARQMPRPRPEPPRRRGSRGTGAARTVNLIQYDPAPYRA